MSASEEPSMKKLKMTSNLEMKNHNFEDLPNEILSKVLDYLNIRDLIRCGQSFRRVRFVVQDELLWKKVNLSNKTLVPAGLLQMILERGCEYLNITDDFRMGDAEIDVHLMPFQTNKLKCLSLAWKHETWDIRQFLLNWLLLKNLLDSCTVLETLELSCVSFPSKPPSFCKTLKILRLSYCKGSYESFIQAITDQCVELEELSFYKTFLSEDSIDYLVKNITPKVSKLSLCTEVCRVFDAKVMDKKIEILLNRCNNLTELSLTGSGFTNDSVNFIIKNLYSTLLKLCLIETSVDLMKLCELKAMEKLTALDFYSMAPVKVNTAELESFRRSNPHIQLCYANSILEKPNWSSDNLSTYRSYEE